MPKEYADNALLEMAGYRNRLVHFYFEVSPEELYQILQNNLDDVERFCHYMVEILKDPRRYNLRVE